jgi:hypothetical protein
MDTQRAAEIQVVLEGITLPATRDELISYARRYDSAAAEQLARLPKRSYDSIDSAAEELLRVQPAPKKAEQLPAPVSGFPPGGSDYVNPRPMPGAVRESAPEDNPPKQTIEQQTQTQKQQSAVQKAKPLPGPVTTT